MTITGTNTIKIVDVLVGDVWLGSGQSNMQWAVRQADNADAEIASAKFPEIRMFYVPRKPSAVPVDDVDAKWVVCHRKPSRSSPPFCIISAARCTRTSKYPWG